jgi:diaminopimelate epimerase
VAEHHPRFPDRANIEFIRIDSPREVTMRVWERGVGETLACGSGACAVGVSAVLDHGCESPVTVHLPGGDLEIAIDDDLRVTMTGAAREIYTGEVDPSALDRRPDASTTGKALA